MRKVESSERNLNAEMFSWFTLNSGFLAWRCIRFGFFHANFSYQLLKVWRFRVFRHVYFYLYEYKTLISTFQDGYQCGLIALGWFTLFPNKLQVNLKTTRWIHATILIYLIDALLVCLNYYVCCYYQQ
jgi:hypothetical protein